MVADGVCRSYAPSVACVSDRPSLRKWLIRVIFVAIPLTAVGFTALRLPGFIANNLQVRAGLLSLKPKLLPSGLPLSLPNLLRGEIEMAATVYVRNGNWIDIQLQRVQWHAFLNGTEVAEGTLPTERILLSDREDPMQISTLIHGPQLAVAAVELLKLRSADVVVQLHAEAQVMGISVQRDVRLTGFDLRMNADGVDPLAEAE